MGGRAAGDGAQGTSAPGSVKPIQTTPVRAKQGSFASRSIRHKTLKRPDQTMTNPNQTSGTRVEPPTDCSISAWWAGVRQHDTHIGVLFILPFLAACAVFMIYPVVQVIRMSFYYRNPLRPDQWEFVGLENFRTIFSDELFWDSFYQATIWTSSSIVLQAMLGVAFAMLLHYPLRGINIFRGLLLFPYIVPTAVIALMWSWIFNPEIGVLNHMLLSLGIIDENIYWFSTPNMAMGSTIALSVWKYTPFVVICVLAKLQTIPLELYDAAKVDGSGPIRRFLDVTLPNLAEVLMVVVVFRTIWTFNKFEEIYLLTKGGPGTSTFNLAIYSFEQSIANLKLGVGAATGVIMTVMLLLGSVLYLRVMRFGQED